MTPATNRPTQKPFEGIHDDKIHVAYLSDLEEGDAREFIGKTIAKLDAREHSLRLWFTDGQSVAISGHSVDGCALRIDWYPDASSAEAKRKALEEYFTLLREILAEVDAADKIVKP